MPTFTTTQILAYMKTVMANKEIPDLVLLEGGGNDCDHDWARFERTGGEELYNRVPIELFQENLRSMANFWKDKNVPCIMIITPPIDIKQFFMHLQSDDKFNALKDKFPEILPMEQEYNKYKDVMYKIADEYGMRKIDLTRCFDEFENLSDVYSIDGMHPNEKGYSMFKEVFESELKML